MITFAVVGRLQHVGADLLLFGGAYGSLRWVSRASSRTTRVRFEDSKAIRHVVCAAAALGLLVSYGCKSAEKQAEAPSLSAAPQPPALRTPLAPPAPPQPPAQPTPPERLAAPTPQPTAAADPVFTEIHTSALWRVCHANLRACFPRVRNPKRAPQLIDLDWGWGWLLSVRSDGSALTGYEFDPRTDNTDRLGPKWPPVRPRLRRLTRGDPSIGWCGTDAGMFAYTCSIDDARVLVCGTEPWEGRFIDVDAGPGEACAIREDGTLRCHDVWEGERPAPPGRYQQVGVGEHHACALDLEGTAHCWAAPSGDSPLQLLPSPSTRFLELAVGAHHTCGLTQARTLECWGDNLERHHQYVPRGQFEHIAAPGDQTCGLRKTGHAQCWPAYR
jgi:hypothetical protein